MASIGDVYDRLHARRPGAVRGVVTDASFLDIGTVADYLKTSNDLAGPGVPAHGRRAHIADSATVTRSILWDDVTVGERAVVDQCIVTDGVRVPDGATYRHEILRRSIDGRIDASPLAE